MTSTVMESTVSNGSDVASSAPAAASSLGIQPRPVAVPSDTVITGRRIPFMIEKDQAYYWTAKWQDSVDQALADIQAGQYVRFDSDDPTDVARWLWDGNDD
jgi:hypothetical protein